MSTIGLGSSEVAMALGIYRNALGGRGANAPTRLEIGVLFDIDALGGGFYGYGAWTIFMRNCRGENLAETELYEGDTQETLNGKARQFCIVVNTDDEKKADYVKRVMSLATDRGLLPLDQRFLTGCVTTMNRGIQPLMKRARIDGSGSFVTEEYSRIDADLCAKTGWVYSPESAPR